MSDIEILVVPPEGWHLLCNRVGYIPTPSMVMFAAVTKATDENMEHTIHGMVGLDMWTNNSVQAHIVIDNVKCTRRLLRHSFKYIFDNDRNIVIGITPGDLPKAERFMKGIGFEEIYRVKDGNSIGVDTIISEVRSESCKWAEPKQKEEAA